MHTSPALSKRIKRLCHEVRYRSLQDLIGQTVSVTSAENAPYELIPFLKQCLSSEIHFHGPKENFRQGAVAKYGILDLEYDVPAALLSTNDAPGITLLKEFGIVEHRKHTDGDYSADDEEELLTCFDLHIEHLNKHETMLKLFLTTNIEWGLNLQYIRKGLPNTFWPRTFTIEDACLTNLTSIWLSRHFYM